MSGTTNGLGPYAEADVRDVRRSVLSTPMWSLSARVPAGSATATHLARRGLRVSLLEKSRFPREKVCGDGLTPRGTRQLIGSASTPRKSRLAAQQGFAHLRRRASLPAGVA